jgi:hypothetical protein
MTLDRRKPTRRGRRDSLVAMKDARLDRFRRPPGENRPGRGFPRCRVSPVAPLAAMARSQAREKTNKFRRKKWRPAPDKHNEYVSPFILP